MVKAVRTGIWPAELNGHLEDCVICAEVRDLTQVVIASVTYIRTQHELPDAGRIWLQARCRVREAALKRATRSMMLMRGLAAVYALAVAGWLIGSFLTPPYRRWLLAVDTGLFRADLFRAGLFGTVPSGVLVGTGAVVALGCVAVGSWSLLRKDQLLLP